MVPENYDHRDAEDLKWLEELIEFSVKSVEEATGKELVETEDGKDAWNDDWNFITSGKRRVRYVYSEEMKRKWRDGSKWKKGYKRSKEVAKKISLGHQKRRAEGKTRAPISKEAKANISRILKNKFASGYKRPPITEEVRAKLRAGHEARKIKGIKRRETDWALAAVKSKVTRELKKLLGEQRKPVSDEAKQKLKDAWSRLKAQGYMPKKVSDETRVRMSEAQKKRFAEQGVVKHSEETKRKMSEIYAQRIASGWRPPKKKPESIAKAIATRADNERKKLEMTDTESNNIHKPRKKHSEATKQKMRESHARRIASGWTKPKKSTGASEKKISLEVGIKKTDEDKSALKEASESNTTSVGELN